ncbi:hypothetical protein [Halomonas maura]|uniref:hypothetical protein n=1 Tax=Halomonas maura TaxID=117606 RepID=UPI0025B3FFCD|nr:hypothetical protein [Halomonas maura]MDN3556950.1 hypothetical protein [Halomonas maura]
MGQIAGPALGDRPARLLGTAQQTSNRLLGPPPVVLQHGVAGIGIPAIRIGTVVGPLRRVEVAPHQVQVAQQPLDITHRPGRTDPQQLVGFVDRAARPIQFATGGEDLRAMQQAGTGEGIDAAALAPLREALGPLFRPPPVAAIAASGDQPTVDDAPDQRRDIPRDHGGGGLILQFRSQARLSLGLEADPLVQQRHGLDVGIVQRPANCLGLSCPLEGLVEVPLEQVKARLHAAQVAMLRGPGQPAQQPFGTLQAAMGNGRLHRLDPQACQANRRPGGGLGMAGGRVGHGSAFQRDDRLRQVTGALGADRPALE